MGNLVMGAHGAVGTLYNFMPQVFHRLLQHLSVGEIEKARKEQIRGQKVLRLMIKHDEINYFIFKIYFDGNRF